jgi:hypothetical protein
VYERCLQEAERILATDKDVIVPVKRVWNDVVREGQSQDFEVPALADFTALLEADPTFEFMSARTGVLDDIEEERPDVMSEEEEELERMGFYAGDRVKLKRISLTPETLGDILRSKVDRTMEALTKAWDRRPSGDADTEERLQSILSETKKLQRDVRKAFSKDKMKRISKALKKKPSSSTRKGKTKSTTRPPAKTRTTRKRRTTSSSKTSSRKRSRR